MNNPRYALVALIVLLSVGIVGYLSYVYWQSQPVTVNVQAKAYCTDPEHKGNRSWGTVPVTGTLERKYAKVLMKKKMVIQTCPQCQQRLDKELPNHLFSF